jgi:DNA replication and repair protein RecF
MTGEREIPRITYVSSSGLRDEDRGNREALRDRYEELLMSNHDREIAMGATVFGIHKDDLAIDINGHRARIYGSQGQQRSLALAMKLAEGEICREEYGDYPVFLLDDVLSELDSERRDYLLHRIRDKQVILTGCDPDLMRGEDEVRRILVREGCYSVVE